MDVPNRVLAVGKAVAWGKVWWLQNGWWAVRGGGQKQLTRKELLSPKRWDGYPCPPFMHMPVICLHGYCCFLPLSGADFADEEPHVLPQRLCLPDHWPFYCGFPLIEAGTEPLLPVICIPGACLSVHLLGSTACLGARFEVKNLQTTASLCYQQSDAQSDDIRRTPRRHTQRPQSVVSSTFSEVKGICSAPILCHFVACEAKSGVQHMGSFLWFDGQVLSHKGTLSNGIRSRVLVPSSTSPRGMNRSHMHILGHLPFHNLYSTKREQ